MKDLNLALEVNSQDTLAYAIRGKIYLEKDNDTTAYEDLNRALSLDGNNVMALTYMGMLLLSRGQNDSSMMCLSKAVELAPKDEMALYEMGNLYFNMEKFQDAIKNYNIVYENRGISYYNLKFFRQAAFDFESAMKFNPALTDKLKIFYLDAKARAGM
jgi:tetratricopeptide (TPR) repeat protein